jgi:hypothetical protein
MNTLSTDAGWVTLAKRWHLPTFRFGREYDDQGTESLMKGVLSASARVCHRFSFIATIIRSICIMEGQNNNNNNKVKHQGSNNGHPFALVLECLNQQRHQLLQRDHAHLLEANWKLNGSTTRKRRW